MQTFNDITEEQKNEYQFHYAALYPLYINAKSTSLDGRARLWTVTRWDPRKDFANSEYESITFEMQISDADFKLESWVFGNRLIILITKNDVSVGLHPTKNYHLDLNDPNSISNAIDIVDMYISEFRNKRNNTPNKNTLAITTVSIITSILSIIMYLTIKRIL